MIVRPANHCINLELVYVQFLVLFVYYLFFNSYVSIIYFFKLKLIYVY